MPKTQLKNMVITVLFVLVMGLPILSIELKSHDYSASENRLLAPFPTIMLEDGTFNTNVGKELKEWLQDHIGLRKQFVQLSAEIKLKLFNQSPSEQVHIGKDGWYYYTGDENLQISDGTYTLTPGILEDILQCHLRIQEKLEQRGIEYIIVLPPSKVSIYPEYMRYGDECVRETPVDIVADYLEKNSDIKVVRLKEALLEAKEDHQVFYKTDTHWNQVGAYVAYQEIIQNMNRWGLCTKKPVEVDLVEGEYIGEFGQMMGYHTLLGAEPTYNTVIPNPTAVLDGTSKRSLGFIEMVKQTGVYNPCYYYTNTDSSLPQTSVLMFGDSMFGEWNATQLLAENFYEFSYIWSPSIQEVYLDYLNPDIVVYEITERHLNIFPQHSAGFLQKALSDYNAEILSYRVSGEDLEVTVRNNSGSEWRRIDQVRCGLWVDGADSGIRATLEPGVVVKPGDEITFCFENVTDSFTANVELTMLQENYCYFGEREPVYTDWNADIVSYSIPALENSQELPSLSVTVKNTGNKIWNEKERFRLCIWQDGKDNGYRILLPEGVTVAPGEEYTFTKEGLVMPMGDSTVLGFQMLQEDICYFGEKEEVTIQAEVISKNG